MNAKALIGMAGFGAVLGALAACSGPSSPAPVQGADNDIIGGVDAKSASLDAIGTLMFKDPQQNNTLQMLCTATLIAPRVILTAKHCAFEKSVDQADGAPAQVVETRFIDVYPMFFAI